MPKEGISCYSFFYLRGANNSPKIKGKNREQKQEKQMKNEKRKRIKRLSNEGESN